MIRVTAAAMIVAMFLVLTAFTRRPRITFLWTLELVGLIFLASWVKQANEGMAMTLTDLYVFSLNPAENLLLFWNYPTIGLVFVAVVGLVVSFPAIGRRFEPPMAALSTTARGLARRGLIVLVAVVICVIGIKIADAEPARSAYVTMASMRPNGIYERLNVFFENRGTGITLPALKAQNRFKRGASAAHPTGPALQRPDILMVFEESVFDPTMVNICRFPECDLPMFHPLAFAASGQEGPLLTHTTGGGSWLTEFAFLSGLDWRLFGPGGGMAPMSIAPRLHASLPRKLHALGYRSVAVYAIDEDFLGGRSAYRHYGFDEFYGARELKLSKDWLTTPDHTMFEKALAIANRPEDPRPLFVFVFTVRTHGPYKVNDFQIPEEFRTISRGMSPGFADYLSRLQDSSKTFINLAKGWLDSSRPRVIGWFGDHQPQAAWQFLNRVEDVNRVRYPEVVSEQLKFVTRYQLSSNQPPRATLRPKLHTLDIAYLGNELLEFAGLPQDDAGIAGLSMAEQCRGRFLDCEDGDLVADYVSYLVHDLKAVE